MVNVTGVRNAHCIPCSCTVGPRRLRSFSRPSSTQLNVALASTSARGNKIQLFPSGFQPMWRSGRPTPFVQNSHFLSLIPCQAKKDMEESLSGENIISVEQTLRQNLQIAIEEENYAQAAKIRDSLRTLHEDSKASVLAANSRFYDSFRKGDLASMQALWAKLDNVCCVHPGANGISGYDFVMESWEVVWMNYEFPLEIELKDIRVHVRGDVGYVTCMEYVKTKGSSWGGQFVTNVFERINGQWFICIHHASPVDL